MHYMSEIDEIVLFLDIDGALLDFAATPQLAQVSDELRNCIADLQIKMENSVAFVSGRTLDDVDKLFAPLKLMGAFSHGGEFRYPDYQIVRHISPTDHIPIAFCQADAWQKKHPDVHVEFKNDTLALHYRTAPDMESDAKKFAAELQNTLGQNYQLLEGSAVVEIKPCNRNKGYAIRRLMQSPQWQQRIPVFIGVDTTDEDGFKVVNDARGLSIKVGGGDTLATTTLPSPHAVRELLRKLIQ